MSEIENTEMSETAEATEATETTETTLSAGEAVETVEPAETVQAVEAGETVAAVEPETAIVEPEAQIVEPEAQVVGADAPNVESTAQPDEPEAQPDASEAKPKKRIRSTTLFTAAVVIGVLGGVGTGYGLQFARPATPLPPLAGSQPAYLPTGVYQGIAPTMLPSSQDDATLTDGDLTKLLLPVPAGASTENSIWLDQMINVEEDADLCQAPVNCFSDDFSEGVVAIADTNWQQNGDNIEIRIYRMAPGESGTARTWAEDYDSDTNEIPIPTGINGSAYEFFDKYDDNDDTAYAVHGDIAVQFWVTSPSAVPNPSIIDGLITQQMGRL